MSTDPAVQAAIRQHCVETTRPDCTAICVCGFDFDPFAFGDPWAEHLAAAAVAEVRERIAADIEASDGWGDYRHDGLADAARIARGQGRRAATAERDEARAATARVRALCEQRKAEHDDYVRRVQDGTLVTLDRFIGPAQVNVADVLAALDVRHDPSATTDDDYYVIEVDPETARLNVTYPSATTDGGAP